MEDRLFPRHDHKPCGIRPDSEICAMLLDELLQDAEIQFLLSESGNDGRVLKQEDKILLTLIVLDGIIFGALDIAKPCQLKFPLVFLH